jgi:glycosidase
MKILDKLIEKLNNLSKNNSKNHEIFIPAVWQNINSTEAEIKVDFPTFLINQIEIIQKFNEKNSIESKNLAKKNPTIYNLFIRFCTAFDHNRDGKITNEIGKFKETGTFLKTIAILPYLKNLGVEILYFLPINSIGIDGKKGDLGSPYSINNPYKLDENLGEPLLEIEIEKQFLALVEAAHLIGMKVVTEFIFRTASKDSSLAISHPEWFYWIKNEIKDRENSTNNQTEINEENYGSPYFSDDKLIKIRSKIAQNDFDNLPEPSENYQKMFTEVPEKVEIIENKIIGTLKNGEKVRIPGAFADWPPDDIQPAWSDVTYLKFYDNPDFNYIAYNTVRMYDNLSVQPKFEITDLWRNIENIIPFYQKKFGIDGVMIDMGHALPKKLLGRIISKARKNNPDFLFWEENFASNENSVKAGFNLVLGFLFFDENNCEQMKNCIKNIEQNLFPIPFFATPETHNTPRAAARAGKTAYSKIAYLLNKLLPLPNFIHSGFELGETFPVNTGVGFGEIDTTDFTAEKLPLFSTSSLPWTYGNNLIKFIQNINDILDKKLDFSATIKSRNIVKLIENENKNVLCFLRKTLNENINLLFIANYSNELQNINLEFSPNTKFEFLFGENNFTNDFTENSNKISINISEHNFILLEIE